MPLNMYTKFPLSDHPLMDISVASTSWLLEIVLQWTWLWKNHFQFLLSINLDIHWKMKLLNHVVILFFKFSRNLHNVSHRSALFLLYSHQLCTSILISPDPRQLSLFPLPFPSLYSSPPYFSVFFFETGHLKECEVISYCGFDLVSRWFQNLSPFHMLVGHLCISSGNMSIQHFANFKNWIVHFLLSSYRNYL